MEDAWVRYRAALIVAGCLVLSGCDWFQDRSGESAEDPEIAELADDPVPAGSAASPAAPGPAAPQSHAPASRTVLVKSVAQKLRQRQADGWVDSRTAIELTMALTLEESHVLPAAGGPNDPRDGQRRYRVRYERIRLLHELPGQASIQCDSDTPPASAAGMAAIYLALKGNGFDFWLDRHQQVIEVIHFDQFLDRCLQAVAAEDRAAVRAALPAASPFEGVTCFIDDTIGVLPADVTRAGDSWMRTKHLVQPVPLMTNTRYTVRQMTAETADIDLVGTVAPAVTPGAAGGVQVSVRGGQLAGQCRVDRVTGLPVRSQVEQSLEMTVRLADGSEFEQYKTTVSTIGPPGAATPVALHGGTAPASPAQR